MNALAQNVTKLSKDYEALKKKCRQQQAEIAELKIKKETLNLNLNNLIKEWTALQAENEALKEKIKWIEGKELLK